MKNAQKMELKDSKNGKNAQKMELISQSNFLIPTIAQILDQMNYEKHCQSPFLHISTPARW